MGSLPHAPVSLVVIGVGMIGTIHINAIQSSKDAVLTAIVDPTPGGKEVAQGHGCEYFLNVDGLLKSSPRPDGAIICTPNETHVSISQQLAEAGIHLLIEKPMSTNIREGRLLLGICHSHGVRVCVGHHRRFHSSVKAAKSALDSDSIGEIIGVSGLWASLKTEDYFQGHGQWRGGENGGIVLINLVHELDLLQYFVGPIVRVYAEQAPSTRGNDAEEGVAVTLRFENGAVGTFLALDNCPSPFSIERGTGENPAFPFTGKDCHRFFGRKGTLSAPDGTFWTPRNLEKGWHSDLIERKLRFEEENVYAKQIDNFIGVIRGCEEPTSSGESGLAAVAACEAVRKSLEVGMPVAVERETA